MTSAIIIILAMALCVAGWFLFDTSCDLAVANRKIESLRRFGARLERRDNPKPTPTSDKWHWYASLNGEEYAFTDEALLVAAERAANLNNK